MAASTKLVAETKDVRAFARLLRGIGLKHNAVMTLSAAGFEVTVEEVKSLCAIAWIPNNLFETFSYNSDQAQCFEISLDALLQCLNIFGNAGSSSSGTTGSGRIGGNGGGGVGGVGGRNRRRWAGEGDIGEDEDLGSRNGNGGAGGRKEKRTGMRMTWDGPGRPLEVLLQDDTKGPTTSCELSTLEPEELMNQMFNDDDRVVYMIMRSEWFRDALLDLPLSCSRVTLDVYPARLNHGGPSMNQSVSGAMSQTSRGGGGRSGGRKSDLGSFSIHAKGDFGDVQFDYPNAKEVMDVFECDSRMTFSYHASHITMLSRALQHSTKLCLQIESEGFLSIQIMMPMPDNMPSDQHNGILEFKMNALEDDD